MPPRARARLGLALRTIAATSALFVAGPAAAREPLLFAALPSSGGAELSAGPFARQPHPVGPTIAAANRLRLNGGAPVSSLPDLSFHERPRWIRALEYAAERGITVARLRDGRDLRFVLGVHHKGYIGFFTVPKE